MQSVPEPVVEGLGPAALAVIVLLGVAVSVLVGQNVRRAREADVERSTRLYAEALGAAVSTEIGRLYDTVDRRAKLWGSAPAGLDPERWQEAAQVFLHENPATMALFFADPSWAMVGTPEGKRLVGELLPDVRHQLADASGEFLLGPLRTADGRHVLAIQVRASDSPKDKRVVFALIDLESALAKILDVRALGYALAVSADGEELYRRAPSDPKQELQRLRRSAPVTVRNGSPWSLSAWPTSELTGMLDLPSYWILVPGLVASALVAAAVHFGTLAWRRESALHLANAALSQQLLDTRRGEGELRELSEALEVRVRDRTSELQETIAELETFNYSVSHDLRGPLGAVVNFAAILSEDYGDRVDAIGREHLQRIVGSAAAAVSMMDALLAYSRSGRMELQKTRLEMRRLVEDVCDELSASAPHLKCAIRIGELPDAFADESMIRCVFSNLIGNACKFTEGGAAPRVEVGGSAEGNEVIYFVRDEGVGFDMRFADKLFKVFERLHPSDQYEGHGVGLAIVARMVRRNGGRVWAQAAVGKGATFYFSLPPAESGHDGRPS